MSRSDSTTRSALLGVFHLEGQHRAEASHLRTRAFEAGVGDESGVANALDVTVVVESFGELGRGALLASEANGQACEVRATRGTPP